MLRMVLLGLLIPLGVGVLAAIELRTPPPTAAAAVQSLAETTVGISDSPGALAKADRLEINYAKSETPAQPDLADERISPSEATTIGSSKAPSIQARAIYLNSLHRPLHDAASTVHCAAQDPDSPQFCVQEKLTELQFEMHSEKFRV